MGHELTNLFILAGSLFLLFIGYLAYQLASTEKGTRNLLLFFVVCILIFIFSIHFLMYRFENASEAQPKIIEKYEIVRGKTEQLIQGKGFGLLTVYNMSLSENNQFGFYYYNQDGDIERMSINFDDIKIKEVEEDTARLEVYAPLIQQRIRLKMRLPLHTGSLIQVSSDIKSGNGIESEYINRIMKEGDQVDCFLNYIDEMIEMDEKAGKYLKYKLVDELTDEEIALKLGVSRRALYGIKPNAYFRIAIWSHQVAYIKENTYEFIFNYAGLYERLM